MPHIRKAQAGSDSFGNVWDRDGAVVEVPHEQAEQLLVIDDGQFTLAEASDDEQPRQAPALQGGNAAGEGKTTTEDDGPEVIWNPEFSEVVPNAPAGEPKSDDGSDSTTAPSANDTSAGTNPEDETKDEEKSNPGTAKAAAPAKKAAARKTAASKPQE